MVGSAASGASLFCRSCVLKSVSKLPSSCVQIPVLPGRAVSSVKHCLVQVDLAKHEVLLELRIDVFAVGSTFRQEVDCGCRGLPYRTRLAINALANCQPLVSLSRLSSPEQLAELFMRLLLRRQPDGRWTYLIDNPFFGQRSRSRRPSLR
jgi:hypothetical protein